MRNKPRKNKIKQCLTCNQNFNYGKDPEKKYCNHSCAAKSTNKMRAKEKVCMYCKKSYFGAGKKYCSQECMGKSKTKKVIDGWIKNPDSATQLQGLSRSVKLYLIEQSNFQCSRCGWKEINPITQKCPLEVDHVDGDCYNNNPENLRVLCPNCHSLTTTYKALNKNSRRSYR